MEVILNSDDLFTGFILLMVVVLVLAVLLGISFLSLVLINYVFGAGIIITLNKVLAMFALMLILKPVGVTIK